MQVISCRPSFPTCLLVKNSGFSALDRPGMSCGFLLLAGGLILGENGPMGFLGFGLRKTLKSCFPIYLLSALSAYPAVAAETPSTTAANAAAAEPVARTPMETNSLPGFQIKRGFRVEQ